MAFEYWGYQFDGAFSSPESLESLPGVYVIWCRDKQEKWKVLDVGESGNIRERVKNHERKTCWSNNCNGEIYYSATYTPNIEKAKRLEIEKLIRTQACPQCGQ